MQERVNKTPVGEVSQLKQSFVDSWSSLSHDVIDRQRKMTSATPSVCEGQETPLSESSALKPAFLEVTHDFQKNHARVIFGMQFKRR